jgi:ring-1,2-phenylacetyl-CoA epoxidase subunit PaaD
MITTEAVMDVLQTIPDPEMPISIVDLGLIENVQVEAVDEKSKVSIEIVPTFVGCPALEMIANEITSKVGDLSGVGKVDVHFTYDPPWSVDRISDEGRASLRFPWKATPEEPSSCGPRPSSALSAAPTKRRSTACSAPRGAV